MRRLGGYRKVEIFCGSLNYTEPVRNMTKMPPKPVFRENNHPDSSDSSEESEVQSPEVMQFIKRDEKLFTVLGIFAALSVYLTQLPSGNGRLNEVGIVGCLLIFIVLSLSLLYRTWKYSTDWLRDSPKNFFGYVTIGMSLMALIISIIGSLIAYSDTASPLLDGLISTSFVVFYTYQFIIENTEKVNLRNLKKDTVLNLIPLLAGILLVVAYFTHISDMPDFQSLQYTSLKVVVITYLHLIIVLGTVLLIHILDSIRKNINANTPIEL
jgi:hypothetical protein